MLSGSLSKFSWLNGKKVEYKRYYEIDEEGLILYPSLYSQSVRYEKVLERINFNHIREIRKKQIVLGQKFVWHLYLLINESEQEGEILVLDNEFDWTIVELEFGIESGRETFLAEYFRYVKNNC